MSESLGPTDLKPLLDAIIADNPDTRNPYSTDLFSCLYTDPDEPSRHCIIGQLASEQGWELPDVADECTDSADVVARAKRWPVDDDARWKLSMVQMAADGVLDEDDPFPAPWGTIDLEGIFGRA